MKKIFKNKKNLIKLFLFIVMIYFFIVLGGKDYHTDVTDNVRFATEYKDISKNNIYKYIGEHEVMDILNGKSGILFMGFPSNIWSHYYADYLNEIAIYKGISEIYYYDFKRDRSLNNTTYHNIVNKLKSYLIFDDLGNVEIEAPTVVIVKDGTILYFDNEVQLIKGDITPEVYFTDYRKELVKSNFMKAIDTYLGSETDEG